MPLNLLPPSLTELRHLRWPDVQPGRSLVHPVSFRDKDMTSRPPNHRGSRRRALILVSVWVWVLLLYTHLGFDTSRHEVWASQWTQSTGAQSNRATDVFAIPPVDNKAIKKVCQQASWNETLVFVCNESYGGIGNIRNSILLCIRYAMQAGASLVLPRIILRSPFALEILQTTETADFSYMFDTKHFLESMRLSCPQMKIYKSTKDVSDKSDVEISLDPARSLTPESLVKGEVPRTGLLRPGAWRGQFFDWLREANLAAEKSSGAVIIYLERSYMTYPIYSDGDAFALSFASLLQFRNDTRVLATKVLRNLVEEFSLHVNLNWDILPEAFFGAHLRTEEDSMSVWESAGDYWFYSHYSNQLKVYQKQAPRSKPAVIYVASGDLNEADRFAEDVADAPAPNNYTVVTKSDLLGSADLAELEALTFDQQALVDYLVLLKASDFAGVAHSSFAWSIALKRHQHAKRKTNFLDAPEMLDDDLSKLYGTVKDFGDYPTVLWP